MNTKEIRDVTVQVQVSDAFGLETKQLEWAVLKDVSLERFLRELVEILEKAEL